MNQQNVLLSLGGSASSSYGIAYLMSDELFEAIEFGDYVTTGTVSADYIVVASTAVSEFTINSNGPITLTFNPSGVNLPRKIIRIVYQFDDGTSDKTFSFYYSPTSEDTMNLPFSAEPGDPRNFTFTKSFYSLDYFINTTRVIISVYQLGIPDPTEIIYNVNVISPEMDGLGSGYFEEMHLISTRMFGPNNDILYTFETINPNYVIPMLINWNKAPEITVQTSNVVKKPARPYRILSPFEIETINQNGNIKIIKEVNSGIRNDRGEYQTFRLLNGYPFFDSNNPDLSATNLPTNIMPHLSGYLSTQDGKYLRIGNYFNSNINR